MVHFEQVGCRVARSVDFWLETLNKVGCWDVVQGGRELQRSQEFIMLQLWKHKVLDTGTKALVTRSLPAKIRPIFMTMTPMPDFACRTDGFGVVQALLG